MQKSFADLQVFSDDQDEVVSVEPVSSANISVKNIDHKDIGEDHGQGTNHILEVQVFTSLERVTALDVK